MQDYHKLKVWEKSHLLTKGIYELTKRFPREELYDMAQALRRTCMTIPMKIAEGCGRESDAELLKCLWHARGISSEVDYLILLAKDLEYITPETYEEYRIKIDEVMKMLSGFIKTINHGS